MATAGEWVQGARPRTLPAAVAPVVVGLGVTAYTGTAYGTAQIVINGLLALLVSLSLQIGVNFYNDFHDGVRGTDEVRVGPVRLVGQGLAPAAHVRTAAVASLLLASVFGLLLVLLSGAWILIPVGIAAIVAAWAYTGGSRPYGYLGLGELFVFIFFGPVAVCGTTLVTGGQVWPVAALASVITGLLTVGILITNNLRDLELDEQSGKNTLAVRMGDQRTRQVYTACMIVPFVLVAWMAILTTGWALLAMAGAVPAVKATQEVLEHAYGKGLIPVLQSTSFALMLTGLGLGIGLAI